MTTPAELYAAVVRVVEEGEDFDQTLMYETLGIRWGEQAITANVVTQITLNQPYDAGVTDYLVWRQVRTSKDQEIEVVVIDATKTNTTFEVWAPKDCTFKFMTTRFKIQIDT